MEFYQIAGIKIIIKGEHTGKIKEFLTEFSDRVATGSLDDSTKKEEPCITITYKGIDNSDELQANSEILKSTSEKNVCYGIRCLKCESGSGQNYVVKRENPLTGGFLLSSDGWNEQTLIDDCVENSKIKYWNWKRQFTKDGVLDEDNEWIELFLTGFYSFATLHNTMMIHASAVKFQEKAVLFTAPSGTGKTTQAELWREFAGAEILNGDRVFIKSTDSEERLYAWGSPWAGSSPYIVNDSAEVAAIVVLEQAPENSLRKMDVAEAMMHLSSNSFLPMWDARCLEGMLGVMDLVLRKVPVYKLACRPDEGAVELVRQELFG